MNDVRSRNIRENASAALTSAQKASLDLQIFLTNDKAGIEDQLVRVAKRDRNEVEAAMHMVTVASRKGQAAITGKQTNIKGEIVGDSLMEILHEANINANRKDINAYLIHLLNTDRAPRGKAVFEDVTAEDSAKEIARLEKEHPEFLTISSYFFLKTIDLSPALSYNVDEERNDHEKRLYLTAHTERKQFSFWKAGTNHEKRKSKQEKMERT